MSKLKYRVILPALQLFIALAGIGWYYAFVKYQSASKLLFRPAVSSAYHAMSAPAWVVGALVAEGFRSVVLAVLPSRLEWSSPSIHGLPLTEMLFLMLVATLWFWVGHELDRRAKSSEPQATTLVSVVPNLLLMLLGVILAIGAVHGIGDLLNPAKLLGSRPFAYFGVPAEVMFSAWALALIFVAGRRLVSALRPHHPNLDAAQRGSLR